MSNKVTQASAYEQTSQNLNNRVIDHPQEYLDDVETKIVYNQELNEGEASLFGDGSAIVRIEDSYRVVNDYNTNIDRVEFFDDEYVYIDSEKLINDCESCVFVDSYGNGVALYNNESCKDYVELAQKAGLDFSDYIEFSL